MKIIIFLLLMANCSCSFAQRADPGRMTNSVGSFGSGSITGGNDSFTYGNGIDMNSLKYSDINGSPFLNKDYAKAYIIFKNGKSYADVPVKFDIMHNEIDIEKDKKLISLLGIDSISYPDSTYENMILKTNYPSVNGHDTNTIYQVVAQNNKIQLLKYYRCQVSTIRTLGLPDQSSFDMDKQYYLFNKATKTIKEIKLTKKSFSSAIAEMGYSKDAIDKDKNIDFRNEKEVAGLVSSANL